MSTADSPAESDASAQPPAFGEFEPGDRVVVRSDVPARSAAVSEHDAPSVGVIVAATGERAGETLLDTGETVAEFNADLGDFENDLVVQVAFIEGRKGLRSTLGKSWVEIPPAKLRDRIAEFKREWSVAPTLYSYPESRLLSTDVVDLARFEQ